MTSTPTDNQVAEKNISTNKALSHSTSITDVADFDQEQLLPCKNVAPKSPYADRYTNFCSAADGAKILFATDDWFACADNLLKDSPPHFDPDAYCEQGKVLDGWETRRRREAGHDWCLIQLTSRAQIAALELDTAHFTGNHTPKISLEIADLSSEELSSLTRSLPHSFERLLFGGVQGTGKTPEEVTQASEVSNKLEWQELLPVTELQPGYENTRLHYFSPSQALMGCLIKINYFPDGGVARLKLWGNDLGAVQPPRAPLYMPAPVGEGPVCTVVPHSSTNETPSRLPYEHEEVSSLEVGGTGVSCSNKHYGEPWRLLQKTLGENMGDGWETARHPCRPAVLIKDPETQLIDSPLMDWAILKLGKVAEEGVSRIILDTKHFRGNYPESVTLEGCYDPTDTAGDVNSDAEWFPLVSRSRMSPDAEHVFDRSKEQLEHPTRAVTHVRLSISPDGGVSRVRVYAA